MIEVILRPRSPRSLALVGLVVGLVYVLLTCDLSFLAGHGAFWDYPVGPWLLDSADSVSNPDILDYLVAYTGFVRSPWHWPLFHVAAIGAPAGTSVVFLDVVPIAALFGRIVSDVSGHFFLPYGAWTGACFVLNAIFAALMVAEGGQRSLLAAIAASILAVSAPAFLHRFGHLPLLAHFLIIGAYYFYLREQRSPPALQRSLVWWLWLVLALLTNPYMFAMVSAIYGAAVLKSWRTAGLRSRLLEPAIIGASVVLTLFALGFIGSGASLSGQGFGHYSMNLLSPFVPQRSGVFPSMQRIIDGTGGQYEGFSYLGVGALALLLIAIFIDPIGLKRALSAHRELAVILLVVTIFAVSNDVWVGDVELTKIEIGSTLSSLSGIYRSSGRMFWPAYYGLMLGSLTFGLARLGRSYSIPLVGACCLFQLIDTEPLRARLNAFTNQERKPLLESAAWSRRIEAAKFMEIYPTFFCSDERQRLENLELQLLAIRADRPFNAAYNPRLSWDCQVDRQTSLAGPWHSDTLYVFLAGSLNDIGNWTPPRLLCERFANGKWCFGRGETWPN